MTAEDPRSPPPAGSARRQRLGSARGRRPTGQPGSVDGGAGAGAAASGRTVSNRALAGEVLVLVDALTCVELSADAALLAQHARATAHRLHALLPESEGAAVPAPGAVGAAAPPAPSPPSTPALIWKQWRFPTEGRVVVPGLTVDIDGCCALVEGRTVQLSVRQTRLLSAVAAHPGRAVPYGALAVVGWRDAATDRRAPLHLQFSALRSVLGLHEGTCRLRAVADTGYRLEPPPR